MIAGLSGRRALDRLRAEGVRASRGPVRMVFCPGTDDISRVAFAIPRSVGSAVQRNRVRRRIRAVLRDLDREIVGLPPAGDLLIGVADPLDHLSYSELRTTMIELMNQLSTP